MKRKIVQILIGISVVLTMSSCSGEAKRQEYLSQGEKYLAESNYEEAIAYNTATRDAYLEQFKLGERSLLDVLDAESELFNSSTEYTTANGNVVVGAYRLYALTGMLLPELGIKEDPLYESPRNQQEKR